VCRISAVNAAGATSVKHVDRSKHASSTSICLKKGLMEKVKLAKQRVQQNESYKLERSWYFTKMYRILHKIQGIGTHVLCGQYDYPTQSGHFPHNFCTLLSPRRAILLKLTMYVFFGIVSWVLSFSAAIWSAWSSLNSVTCGY
jgi:hypothetical protein